MRWVPEWLQSMVSKKEKKNLIQSKLKYPMVWERSNKRDWDLHLKAGLFRSLYLCTHCHYLFDVSTNRLTCHVIFTNWNSLFSEPDRTGPGGRTVKTGNRDENRFVKPKEPDFLLIPWTVKTGVGPLEPVRTVRSNPLANLKKKLNTILFYLIKLSISYKE